MDKGSGRLSGLAMSAEAKALVGHAGGIHPQVLAEKAGLPSLYRRKILFRTDGAGFSCGLLKWIASAGLRHQHPGRQAAWLDIRHRSHARVEGKIRDSKAESLARFPSRWMKANQAWLTVTALACDLRAWLQLLACDDEMATATPKTPRYRFPHVPAVLVRGQPRRRLKIPLTWPWATQIITAFRHLLALPHPT
jgi:hypothetical protein